MIAATAEAKNAAGSRMRCTTARAMSWLMAAMTNPYRTAKAGPLELPAALTV